MDAKRSFDSNGAGAVVKRARFEGDSNDDGQQMVVSSDAKGRGQLVASVKRTSGLQAPIVRLDGHSAEVLDIQFDSTGEILASASTDKSINLWRVYGENANFGVLRAQNGAITSLAFTPSQSLVAASTDKTVATFDIERGEVVRRHRGHRAIVNCVDVTKGGNRELIASASDDGLVKIWDVEAKLPIDEVELGYPVTSVKWSEDGQQLFIGGIDNDIHVSRFRTVNQEVQLLQKLICSPLPTVLRPPLQVRPLFTTWSQRHSHLPRSFTLRHAPALRSSRRHMQDLGRAAVRAIDKRVQSDRRPKTVQVAPWRAKWLRGMATEGELGSGRLARGGGRSGPMRYHLQCRAEPVDAQAAW